MNNIEALIGNAKIIAKLRRCVRSMENGNA